MLAGAGTYTAALAGGALQTGETVESWDGTNWTEVADLNTGPDLYMVEQAGTQTAYALLVVIKQKQLRKLERNSLD